MRVSNKFKALYFFIVASTALYGISGVVAYKAVQLLPLGNMIFLYAIGNFLGFFLLYKPLKMRLRVGLSAYGLAATAGIIMSTLLYLLFFAYTHYNLAQIFPFMSLSALLFFFIDIVIYRRNIPLRLGLVIMSGMLLMVLGAFFTGSTGFSFNILLLPLIVAFIVLGGIGNYLYFYKIKTYSIGSKELSFISVFFVLGLFLTISHGFGNAISPGGIAYSIIAGFTGIAATIFELHAIKGYEQGKISKLVAQRNFINSFTYLDTVLVLIGSIIIGSFTYLEVLGGLGMVVGIIIISWARPKGHMQSKQSI